MPNLKDIRRRIKSVKNTEKITQAMRMVAAAKVRRAETRVKAARPYGKALREVFTGVYNAIQKHPAAISGTRYRDLFTPRTAKNVAVVVISSDRGLCGGFNTTIIRSMFKLEREMLAKDLAPTFYLVGRKVVTAFGRYGKSPVLGSMLDMTAAPTHENARMLTDTLMTAFEQGQIDAIEVVSTHFRSMISYKVMMTPLIPVTGLADAIMPEIRPDQAYATRDFMTMDTPPEQNIYPELQLEPSPEAALDELVPMYLANVLYTLMLESSASELAARMTAMTSATSNASEMISELTVQYNKARQSAITQEILEIVSGAEALN